MARRMDPEVCITELLEELNGCNDQGHCSAMIRLLKVLKRQDKMLSPYLRRRLIRTLRTFVVPYGESVIAPAEAVRCLGTNVLWDRDQAKWLSAQQQLFNTKTLMPVQEAINEVFLQQRQRRNHVCKMVRDFNERFALD